MSRLYEEQEVSELLDVAVIHNELILHNDDVNTFDFVIETLKELCGHTTIQAEQCTFLVHYTGKCSVKKGPKNKLKPICEAMLDRGLSAEIQ